jgi:hypothetical protein
MKITEFSLIIKGALWRIHEITIENIDMKDKLKEDNAKSVAEIKIKELISEDNNLDILINLGAPNNTKYTIELNGNFEENNSTKNIKYSKDFIVTKNGRINILISEPITKLLK